MAHICSYLAQRAACLPDKILTVCLEHTSSTQVVSLEVAGLSKALREAHGIRLGDRIGLIAKGNDAFLKASSSCDHAHAVLGNCAPSHLAQFRRITGCPLYLRCHKQSAHVGLLGNHSVWRSSSTTQFALERPRDRGGP